MRLEAFAAPALLALGACTGDASRGDASLETVRWSVEDSSGSASMTAFDDGPVLRLSCENASDQLRVEAFTFTPEAGSRELAFGTLDATYRFAARAAEDGRGIVATGPIPVPLFTSFLSAGAVSAVYGSQRLGPLILPDRDAYAFSGHCLGQLGAPVAPL